MKTTKKDDRTTEQRKTHTLAVVARDNFLSGWGACRNGYSRCAWVFDPRVVDGGRVLKWVESRSEMRYVNLVEINHYRPSPSTEHFHIYVCDPGHPATL